MGIVQEAEKYFSALRKEAQESGVSMNAVIRKHVKVTVDALAVPAHMLGKGSK